MKNVDAKAGIDVLLLCPFTMAQVPLAGFCLHYSSLSQFCMRPELEWPGLTCSDVVQH